MFPEHKGRQWYPTSGFREAALFYGASQRSYRQTVKSFNHSHRQEVDGTPLTTLRDVAQNEGLKVLDFITHKSESVFKEFNFTAEGEMTAACTLLETIPEKINGLEQSALQPLLIEVCEDMKNRGLAINVIESVKKTVIDNDYYEPAAQCVYLHVDKIGVKEQKPHRKPQDLDSQTAPNKAKPEKIKHPTVQNSVARIEHGGKGFTLTGRSVAEVLKFVLAFLLNNGLLGLNIKVCTDGERNLLDAVRAILNWHPHLTFLLDWFHLVKKFKEGLSTACKGREIRNAHLKKLLPLLWFGLVDKALDYLQTIPATDLKEAGAISKLSNYLQRHHKSIPCYAMRSKLKLPNASSPAERTNNQVTANRQKHHGMSWSNNGSYGLTALSAVTVNGATQEWVEKRTISFVLRRKAA